MLHGILNLNSLLSRRAYMTFLDGRFGDPWNL